MAKEQNDLQELGERLKKVRHSVAPEKNDKQTTLGTGFSMMNVGMTIVFSLLGSVLIGTIIGLFFDRWLGTSPWLLIVMLLFGTAAGITTAVRMAKELEAPHSAATLAMSPATVWDDEEEWLHDASNDDADAAIKKD